MGTEVEIKLEVSPDMAGRVPELPWLREIASGPARQDTLVSVYFDTAKQKLRARGLQLRVRHVGGKRIQTIKAENKGASSGLGRGEWEEEIAGDSPDLRLAKGTPLEKLVTRKLKRKLRPVFETVIERTAMPLRCDGTTVELALDRGLIRAGEDHQPVSEIEVEVKSGDPGAVASLAERLARAVPATYGVLSKAERGYALRCGETGIPVRSTRVFLDRSATTGDAFASIGLSCLKQVLANQAAVHDGEAEGIHQMRVGLRRLRAAISLFKPLLRGAETEAVKRELKWLTEKLGPAREYEVLIGEGIRPLRESEPGTKEFRALNEELAARRGRVLDRARGAVESGRFRDLGLRTAIWLANGAWSRNDDPLTRARRDRPAANFAADLLARRTRKILKKVKRVMALTPRKRHKLRIAIKKLRYGTDFFANLFGAKKHKSRKAFVKVLKSLQGSLGTLNDIAAHRRLAKTIVDPQQPLERKAESAFAMGVVTGVERDQVETCLAAARTAGRKLANATPFWR